MMRLQAYEPTPPIRDIDHRKAYYSGFAEAVHLLEYGEQAAAPGRFFVQFDDSDDWGDSEPEGAGVETPAPVSPGSIPKTFDHASYIENNFHRPEISRLPGMVSGENPEQGAGDCKRPS